MGLLDRLRGNRVATAGRDDQRTADQSVRSVTAQLYEGDDDLEVVGESNYQAALWSICGGTAGDQIRHEVIAVLVPEPDNAFDSNAIAIQVEAKTVGYLARDVAAQYRPGLTALMEKTSAYVALRGVVVGGGYYADGPGRLGVWLEHDRADFGFAPPARSRGAAGRPISAPGAMRTGFTEAWLTDAEDDSYDLSWYDDLPVADRPAIERLRTLLASDPDPIDRHFQFAELETRLYRCRDLYDAALDEFDEACRLHDAEMDGICAAFLAKWEKVPLLETYRQMAIRQAKKKDWDACIWWTERGLALYGNAAAREDAVEDLLKRRNRALSKIEAAMKPRAQPRPAGQASVGIADPTKDGSPTAPPETLDLEILTCAQCNQQFERLRVRGRKPSLCPECRAR